jgi:hypothetical protein
MVLINGEETEKIRIHVKNKKEHDEIKFCGSQIRHLVINRTEAIIKNWTKRRNKSGDVVIESPANIARAVGDYVEYLIMQDENFVYEEESENKNAT